MPLLIAGIFQAVPDAFESVWNFFYAGKLFMLFLVALSLLSISVIIYKARDLRRRLVLPEDVVSAIGSAPSALSPEEAGALATRLRASRSVLGRLGLLALSGDHADKEDASRAVEARAREEVVELESGVAMLEVVITIAPLLGLLGTVSGLVNVFSNLGDTADHSAIAFGIAEALNTTIAGLAIAVPTVVAHSYFMKKIEKMGVRMEILIGGLLASVYRTSPAPSIAADEIEAPAPPAVEPIPAAPSEPTQAEPSEPTQAEPSEPVQPTPTPAPIYTPVPDPAAGTQRQAPPSPIEPASAPAAPETDPAIPRLLAGLRPPETSEPPSPEGPTAVSPDTEQPS